MDLQRRDAENAVAWELRGAWATGRPVALVLSPVLRDGLPAVLRGHVDKVAPSDAFAIIQPIEDPAEMSQNDLILDAAGGYTPPDPLHVPLGVVQDVRKAHFHGGDALPWRPPAATHVTAEPLEGQEPLVQPPPVSKHSRRAAERAASMMLDAQLMTLLLMVDRLTLGAPRGRKREHVRTWEVASEAGRSHRWTARRLTLLTRYGILDRLRDGRADAWRVAR